MKLMENEVSTEPGDPVKCESQANRCGTEQELPLCLLVTRRSRVGQQEKAARCWTKSAREAESIIKSTRSQESGEDSGTGRGATVQWPPGLL